MKYIKSTLITMTLFISTLAVGQEYAFKVLANKGKNEFKSDTTWQPLKTGATLKTSDELKLSENAYVGLVSEKGKPIEIKQAGSYKVADLAKKASEGTNVLTKYTDFILTSNSEEARKNRLSATGAVRRDIVKPQINLMLPPNQSSGVLNANVIIRWTSKVGGPYIVTLKNMFDEALDSIETTESVIEVNLADKKYATENAILVEVKAKADAMVVSEQHLVKKLTTAQQEHIRKSLSEIMGEVSEPTALNKLILAAFYEENNLLIDAMGSYEGAIKLAPDVPSYQEDYDAFLVRHELK